MIYVTDLKGIARFQKWYLDKEVLGLDTETTGLDPYVDKLLLVQVGNKVEQFIFDVKKIGKANLVYLVQLLKDSNKLLLLHNAKFDLKFIYTHTEEMLENIYDTQIIEMVITNGLSSGRDKFPSLKGLVDKYCGVTLEKETRNSFITPEDKSTIQWYSEFEVTQEQLVYSALDVVYLEDIRNFQLQKLVEQKQGKVADLENRLIPVVSSMELNGINLDKDKWLALTEKAEQKYEALEKELKDDIFSRKQMLKVFKKFNNLAESFEYFKEKRKEVKTRKFSKKEIAYLTSVTDPQEIFNLTKEHMNLGSTDQLLIVLQTLGFKLTSTADDALNELDTEDEIIEKIKEYRSQKKLANSFGRNFIATLNPATSKLHTNFNQLGARSGRFSSGKSDDADDAHNMQNIVSDHEYRECFVASPGYKIVGADFSQEEYRLAGAISKERVIIDAYKNGADMHTATASLVNEIPMEQVTKDQRRDAKPVNFSILYGTSEYGMSKKQKIPLERAKWIISTFFKGYPTLAKFIPAFQEKVIKNGYSVTLYGRKRYFEIPTFFEGGWKEREKFLARVRREGFNHIIQGTGADIIKLALCRLYYENPYGKDFRILLTVHDEIQTECKEEIAEEVKNWMTKVMEEEEQKFLGDLPAKADCEIASYWKH